MAICRRLAACADVVIENNTAGVVDKLGLGYAQLRTVKPDLVMLGTSGYGDRGPHRGYVTWGPNIEALSGLATLSGFAERACTITQYAYPDVLSALHGLVAVLAALEHRDRTGTGQYVNVAQLEATIAAFGDVMLEVLATGVVPDACGQSFADRRPARVLSLSGRRPLVRDRNRERRRVASVLRSRRPAGVARRSALSRPRGRGSPTRPCWTRSSSVGPPSGTLPT